MNSGKTDSLSTAAKPPTLQCWLTALTRLPPDNWCRMSCDALQFAGAADDDDGGSNARYQLMVSPFPYGRHGNDTCLINDGFLVREARLGGRWMEEDCGRLSTVRVCEATHLSLLP